MSGGFIYGDHFLCSHDHMCDEVVTMEKNTQSTNTTNTSI